MVDEDALRAAFRGDARTDPAPDASPTAARRAARAARTRAQALSPVRILLQVLLVPLVTLGLTVSIYIRTSPYERVDAMRHLAALAGCETARSMGLAPAFAGEIGYHTRNDPDGDGIACASDLPVLAVHTRPVATAAVPPAGGGAPGTRMANGAKFLRPDAALPR